MPDLPPDVHQRVVQMLDAALADLQQLAKQVQPSRGLGFQQVENRLQQATRAVSRSADRKATIERLKTLDDAISRVGLGGDVAPATKRIRTSIAKLLAELEGD